MFMFIKGEGYPCILSNTDSNQQAIFTMMYKKEKQGMLKLSSQEFVFFTPMNTTIAVYWCI